jgi:hypothetical protein
MHNIKSGVFCQVKFCGASNFPMIAELFELFKVQDFIRKVFIKQRGLSVLQIFTILFAILFKQKRSIWAGLQSIGERNKKTIINDFLNNEHYNWRKLTLHIAKIFTKMYKPDKDKPNVLIIDASPKEKSGRHCEHIAQLTNTSDLQNFNGYEFLAAAWSNFRSCILVDFVLKTGKRLRSSKRCNYPEQSHINQRFRESRKTKLESCLDLIRRAIKHGIKFAYVLWDSAFNSDACYQYVFQKLVPKNIHLVTRLAESKETYLYQENRPDVKAIYKTIKNWDTIIIKGEKIECQSVIVEIEGKYKKTNLLRKRKKKSKNKRGTHIRNVKFRKVLGKAKICFYRRAGKKRKFYALLTTDTKLSATQVYDLYKMRWGIEIVFKDLKQYFGFDQSQSSKYAPQIADLSIKCAFYTMLCVYKERKPNKSKYQLLLEFAYEFEDYCLQLHFEKMFIDTIFQLLKFLKKLKINTIKQLELNTENIINTFLHNRKLKQKIRKLIL